MLFSSLAASLSSAVEEIVAVGLQIGNPAHACLGKQWKNIMRYFFSFLQYFVLFIYFLMWILKAFLRSACGAVLIIMLHLHCEAGQKLTGRDAVVWERPGRFNECPPWSVSFLRKEICLDFQTACSPEMEPRLSPNIVFLVCIGSLFNTSWSTFISSTATGVELQRMPTIPWGFEHLEVVTEQEERRFICARKGC